MKTKYRKAAKHKREILRAAGPDMMAMTLRLAQEVPEYDRIRLETSLSMTVETICHGAGQPSDFDFLLEAVCTARARSRAIKDEQTRDACYEVAEAGMLALQSMRARYQKHGRLGFTGPELLDVRAALDLYYQFLANCTRGQMATALKQAVEEIRSAGCATNEEAA